MTDSAHSPAINKTAVVLAGDSGPAERALRAVQLSGQAVLMGEGQTGKACEWCAKTLAQCYQEGLLLFLSPTYLL